MSDAVLSLSTIWTAAACLKALLIPGYRSTDFEVHRNWLAITYNLPISQWYTEATSEWTLDYPPFFAWFEYVLAQLAPRVVKEDGALDLVKLGQFGMATVVYQRVTVILSELVLFGAVKYYIDTSKSNKHMDKLRAYAIALSIVTSPGLLIIDHIHFQYNGMMYGLLILSMVALRNNRPYLGALLFSTLLCFKHIYLYLAPAYFVYLLRTVVLTVKTNFKIDEKNKKSDTKSGKKPKIPEQQSKESLVFEFHLKETLILGLCTVAPFIVAFAPFVYTGQMENVLARLFPFSRGLTHAYWAPNVWAIYSFVDRLLTFTWYKGSHVAGSTRGLVGNVEFGALPDIEPKLTFFLTLFYQVVELIPLAIWPTYDRFLASLTLCGFASFLFGWHVHEKAILLVIFPFTFLALKERRALLAFVPLCVAGYISLHPLIFTSAEELIKDLYSFAWFVTFLLTFSNLVEVHDTQRRVFLLDRMTLLYTAGFVPLMAAYQVVIPWVLPQYSFLGLMLVSVYCAIGIIASWASLSWLYFFDDDLWVVNN